MIQNKTAWSGVKRLLYIQVAVTAVVAIACSVVSWQAGYSALLGGVVCIVPTQYFAAKLFKHTGARAAKQIVRSFYVGEAVKMLLSIALFTVIFVNVRLSAGAFFIAFIMVQLTFWLAPWIFRAKRKP